MIIYRNVYNGCTFCYNIRVSPPFLGGKCVFTFVCLSVCVLACVCVCWHYVCMCVCNSGGGGY